MLKYFYLLKNLNIINDKYYILFILKNFFFLFFFKLNVIKNYIKKIKKNLIPFSINYNNNSTTIYKFIYQKNLI